MRVRHYILLFLLAMTSSPPAQELEIDRPKPKEVKTGVGLPKGWEKLENGLHRATFRVGSHYHKRHPAQQTARKVLEELGVPFGDGASAIPDSTTGTVTVTNTRSALEMAGAVLMETSDRHAKLATLRTEIYEVTSLQALQLSESSQHEIDHKAERDAALAAVRNGKAKLVVSHSLTTMLGQRAKLEDTYEMEFATKYDQAGKEIESDIRNVGTILECELSGRDNVVWINLLLQHHTADPQMIEMPGKLIAPHFHEKKISTSVNLRRGAYKIVGIWEPTGKPEYAENGLRHVVFVTVDVPRN